MAHRGIILMLVIAPMLVAAALGLGSKMEPDCDRAGIAAEKERSQGGEEKAQSWADWALIKAYQVLGYGKDTSKEVADKAGDVAEKAGEAVKNAVSGGAKYATKQKNKVVDSAARAYQEGERKVGEAYDYEKAKNTASEKTKSKYEAAKEEISDAAGKLGAAMGAGGEEL